MKKFIITALVLIFISSVIALYMGAKYFPGTIRSLIIRSLEDYTGKKVVLGSVGFNIFKGMTIEDLIICEDNIAIINVKKASCAFLVTSIFKKHVIIPSIRIESADIFVTRRPDRSLNIIDVLAKRSPLVLKNGFSVSVYKVMARNLNITYHDQTLEPPFIIDITGTDTVLALALPEKIRISGRYRIGAEAPMEIMLSGRYDIPRGEFTADIMAKDIFPAELVPYYRQTGLVFPDGKIDGLATISVKDNVLDARFKANTRDLVVRRGGVIVNIDSDVSGEFHRDFKYEKNSYSADFDIKDLSISGLELIDVAEDIRGHLMLTERGFASRGLSASIFGLPVTGKVELKDYNNPVLDIGITSEVDLEVLQKIAEEEFSLKLPVNLKGEGGLNVRTSRVLSADGAQKIEGTLVMRQAEIITDMVEAPLRGVNGEFDFGPNGMTWEGLGFTYKGIDYTTRGVLTNYKLPGMQFEIHSKDLDLESLLAVNGRKVTFSSLKGRYLDSGFSVTGDIDIENAARVMADIKGTFNIDLKDTEKISGRFAKIWGRIKPSGKVMVNFILNGNIRDIASCTASARLFSQYLKVFGLQCANGFVSYRQKDFVSHIVRAHCSMYGGTADVTAKIELGKNGFPYFAEANFRGIRIEKLKADTPLKDKDISGFLNVRSAGKGNFHDAANIVATGKIGIRNGRLWQLNLLRGLGALIFTSDFSNVVFNGGQCNFIIKDKAIYTDDLKLKSDLIDMSGSLKIAFGGDVSASLNAQLRDEAMAEGMRRNIASSVGKYSTIEIKGTVREPRYIFRPHFGQMIQAFADNWFNTEEDTE